MNISIVLRCCYIYMVILKRNFYKMVKVFVFDISVFISFFFVVFGEFLLLSIGLIRFKELFGFLCEDFGFLGEV